MDVRGGVRIRVGVGGELVGERWEEERVGVGGDLTVPMGVGVGVRAIGCWCESVCLRGEG